MADGRKNVLTRIIRAVFDRPAAKKVEAEFATSMTEAGKKAVAGFLKEIRAGFDKRMADLKVQLAKGLIDPKQFKVQATAAAKEFNTGLIAGMEKARAAGALTNAEYLKLARTLKTVHTEGQGLGTTLKAGLVGVGVSLAATAAGFLSLTKIKDEIERFFADSVREALNEQQSISRLGVALGTLGLSYRALRPEIEAVLKRKQETTRFDNEDAREALSNLIIKTGDYKTALSLLDVTADIAEKRQTSMAEASNTAGDAALGLTRGMKDLGINMGETGDIVLKIRKNLGDLAVTAGSETKGELAIANNLWKDFEKKIGNAILSSAGLKKELGKEGLRGTLTDLNTWAEQHAGAISAFIDKLTAGAAAFIRFNVEAAKLALKPLGALLPKLPTTGQEMVGELHDMEEAGARRRALAKSELILLAKIQEEGGTDLENLTKRNIADLNALYEADKAGTIQLTKEQGDAIAKIRAEQDRLRRDHVRALAGELDRINTDIAIRQLQIEQELTEQLAKELVRRQTLREGHAPRIAPTIDIGQAQLDKLNTMAAALDQTVIPSIQRTEVAFGELIPPDPAPFATAAQLATSPWLDGLAEIEAQVHSDRGLFAELGQAWAEGGFAGLAALAKQKVKENLASAIEMAARAAGSFALGNPISAGLFLKSAATHGLAALAWRAIAGGGGGGGAGGGSVAGTGGSAANVARGSTVSPPPTEVHIHLAGPGFNALNPYVQKVVYQAEQQARERFGQNAVIRLHREP